MLERLALGGIPAEAGTYEHVNSALTHHSFADVAANSTNRGDGFNEVPLLAGVVLVVLLLDWVRVYGGGG